MNKFVNWICRFIPNHFSNRFLIFCLQFMRRLQRNGNMFALNKGGDDWNEEGFIENQHSMKSIYMGMSTIADAGCEIIATYNALLNLGKKEELGSLIRAYEKDGIMHSGKYGVAPKAIADRLKNMGYRAEVFIPDKKKVDIDAFASAYETLIVTYYNDANDLMKQIHTVCVTNFAGEYVAHNAFCNGEVSLPDKKMSGLIDGITFGLGRPIMLIGVEDKK